MKTVCFVVCAVLSTAPLASQNCPFANGGLMPNQLFVDALSDCTEINGSLQISGDDITNLNGLKRIKKIKGDLTLYNLPNLASLAGLDSLLTIEGGLSISNLPLITSLAPLDSLKTMNGVWQLAYCNSISELRILENLEVLGGLSLVQNLNLTDLQSLSKVRRITGSAFIYENKILPSLAGLENLQFVGGELSISRNDSLASLSVLANLDSVGGFTAIGVNNLQDLHGLENIEFFGDYLTITQEPHLTSLSGLENLVDFNHGISIYNNPLLTDLKGLKNLHTVNGNLVISLNSALTDMQGLEKLALISGNLVIDQNQSLLNLNGLNQLQSVGGDFSIFDNPKLSSLVGLENLESVSDDFWVINDSSLVNFTGMNSLVSIGGDFLLQNNLLLENFSGLETLGAVGKKMTVTNNSGLSNFNGLNGLTKVGGSFNVENNVVLNNLNGMPALHSVGEKDSVGTYFTIVNNPQLETLGNFNALSSINGNFWVRQNPLLASLGNLENLTSIADTFLIRDNNALLNLNGLDGLTSVGGDFYIWINAVLANVDGLNHLQTVGGSLNIESNPGLTTLAGLNQLHRIDTDLSIQSNPLLVDLTGLEKLDTVGKRLLIAGSNAQVNLHGLENLTFVGEQMYFTGIALTGLADFKKLKVFNGYLTISGNPALLNLHGLDSLTSVGKDVFIYDNPLLTDLSGLGGLVSIGEQGGGVTAAGGILSIQENAALQSLEGLNKLTSIAGNFYIVHNSTLQNLNGLESLHSVGSYVNIERNNSLQSLGGLSNLTSVGEIISIAENMALSDCAIFAVCDALLNQPDKVFFVSNATGCNTPAEVEAMCHSIPVLVEIRLDNNANCLPDNGDLQLAAVQVRLSSAAQMTQLATKNNGASLIRYLDAGAFSLSLPQFPTDHWLVCQEPIAILPDTILSDTIKALFLLSPVDPCPEMKVDLGMPANFRGCFATSDLEVSAQNIGGATAKGVKIAVVMPSVLELLAATPPLTAQNSDTLFFEIGDVEPFAFTKVKLTVHTRCDTFLLGQTICLETFTVFENACPTTLPAHSEIKLSAECVGDTTVRFSITNIGDAPTQSLHEFKIYRNENLFKIKNFSLDAHASLLENVPSDGATYRMEATKLDDGTLTFAALEKCGGLTPGWITAFWLDNGLTSSDFDCRGVVLAFDPNEKSAVPSGAGAEHLLAANRPITYTIDFQNTGTDTAFRVLLRDVLDNNLDINTFRPGFASHPYTWEIRGNLLEVLFLPIALPDSNINEPASHGFFSFEIAQKTDLPDGVTLENTANIVFDFNPPIVTNTVVHQIGQLTVRADEPQQFSNLWEVLGNPTRDVAVFRALKLIAGDKHFALYDVAGRLAYTAQFSGQTFDFKRDVLPEGVYFFKIEDAENRVFTGKIVLFD